MTFEMLEKALSKYPKSDNEVSLLGIDAFERKFTTDYSTADETHALERSLRFIEELITAYRKEQIQVLVRSVKKKSDGVWGNRVDIRLHFVPSGGNDERIYG